MGSEKSQSDERKRSTTLDLLRIVACLWVLSFHWSGRGGFYPILKTPYDTSWWPHFLNPISKFGLLGVDVFFILSGAVIANSSINTKPRRFAEARFLRLFPVYFLCTLIAILITPIAANGFNRTQDLFGVTGLQYWAGGPTIIGTSWTLPIEIGFYFLIYLAMYIVGKNGECFTKHSLFRFLVGWLMLITLSPSLNFPSLTFLIVQNYAPYFIYGAVLSLLSNVKDFQKYFLLFFYSQNIMVLF
jgi:peptidoglycan/LPS O-acetylase OafA/YrhL